MNNIELSEKNYLLFAMHYYDNPACRSLEEFEEDLNRVKYLKRLLRRYVQSGELRVQLILNHIITMANVFGIEATTKMLWFKLEKEIHPALNTFLVFLNYISPKSHETVKEVRDKLESL